MEIASEVRALLLKIANSAAAEEQATLGHLHLIIANGRLTDMIRQAFDDAVSELRQSVIPVIEPSYAVINEASSDPDAPADAQDDAAETDASEDTASELVSDVNAAAEPAEGADGADDGMKVAENNAEPAEPETGAAASENEV